MRTIVEPKQHIDKLWSKQHFMEGDTYRLMKYVLRVDHERNVLLHNVVTGQLVVLDQEEAEVVNKLPQSYNPVMEQLVTNHYLVPDGYDEHQQVINLRKVLLKYLEGFSPEGIVGYTILPTTACNARCYYCFEQGRPVVTMTEETAEQVVEFISTHCGPNKKVSLFWFGGEPTVAKDRIDQISEGLRGKGIVYHAKMSSNGYLFDEDLVSRAKNLWHLNRIQICVDGIGKNYNRIKAYPGVHDDPYERVMRNIGLLLKLEIGVILRMNFDVGNFAEFKDVMNEAKSRFSDYKYLVVRAHPIIGEHPDSSGCIVHGSDDWLSKMFCKLNNDSKDNGLNPRGMHLPSLSLSSCMAFSDNSICITPEGNLVKCPEQYGDNQAIGTVQTGIVDQDLIQEWKQVADYGMCDGCSLFPRCFRLAKCSSDYCHNKAFYLSQYERTAQSLFSDYMNK